MHKDKFEFTSKNLSLLDSSSSIFKFFKVYFQSDSCKWFNHVQIKTLINTLPLQEPEFGSQRNDFWLMLGTVTLPYKITFSDEIRVEIKKLKNPSFLKFNASNQIIIHKMLVTNDVPERVDCVVQKLFFSKHPKRPINEVMAGLWYQEECKVLTFQNLRDESYLSDICRSKQILLKHYVHMNFLINFEKYFE